MQQAQNNSLSLVNQLLTGQALPGYLSGLPGGISPEVTQSIVNQSLQDIKPSFQSSGILDSGVAAAISARTSADIRNQAEQFNLQNLSNLLGTALTGQYNAQQPILSQSSQLSQNLAGLRSMNSNSTKLSMNPFLRSFQTSLGSSLGTGIGGLATGGLGVLGSGGTMGNTGMTQSQILGFNTAQYR